MVLLKQNGKQKSSLAIEDRSGQEATQETLVKEVFGGDTDVLEELPSIEKIVALFWLFENDGEIVSYLARLIETVCMFKLFQVSMRLSKVLLT